MAFSIYFGLINVAVVGCGIAAYYYLRQWHRITLGHRLQGRYAVFTHTLLLFFIMLEATQAFHFYFGPIFPYFGILLLIDAVLAVALTVSLFRLYKKFSFV